MFDKIKVARELLHVAKSILAVTGFSIYKDGAAILISAKWPKLFLRKTGTVNKNGVSENVYQALTISSKAELTKKVPYYENEFRQHNIWRGDAEDTARYFIARIKYGFRNIIDNIPQEISEVLIKKEETIKGSEELYKYLTNKWKIHPVTIKNVFNIEQKKEGYFSYGNWKVLIYEDANKDINYIQNLLKDVESALSKKGLSNLAYGEVHVTSRMSKAGVLADYESTTDIVRLAANKRNSKFLDSFLHELGHRNWFKFLSSSQCANVMKKYIEVGGMTKVHFDLKYGDVLLHKRTQNKFKLLEENPDFVRVILVETKNAKSMSNIGSFYTISKNVLENAYTLENSANQNFGKSPKKLWFPSSYSTKDPEEFYSELFSTYLTKGLPPEVEEWFKTV